MGDFSEFSLKTRLFLKAYPWRRIDPVPWAPLAKPLAECRLALLSSAGFVLPEQEPFDESLRGGDPSFIILDVRTPGEFATGRISGAENIDVNSGTFESDIGQLNRTHTYLVYCHAGTRSAQAVDIMAGLGFEELYNMLGGITAWTSAGYPTVP